MKGLQETLAAPSPVRAAEMALIRLCYVADLPSPSDALKALQNGSAPVAVTAATAGAPAAAPPPRGGGGAAALATQPVNARRAPSRPPRLAQPEELHRRRRAAGDAARGPPGAPPDASRARGAVRAGPDRVPSRAAGAARPRPAPRRAARPLDRPALDRLGVAGRRQADAGRSRRPPTPTRCAPRPRAIRRCRP